MKLTFPSPQVPPPSPSIPRPICALPVPSLCRMSAPKFGLSCQPFMRSCECRLLPGVTDLCTTTAVVTNRSVSSTTSQTTTPLMVDRQTVQPNRVTAPCCCIWFCARQHLEIYTLYHLLISPCFWRYRRQPMAISRTTSVSENISTFLGANHLCLPNNRMNVSSSPASPSHANPKFILCPGRSNQLETTCEIKKSTLASTER